MPRATIASFVLRFTRESESEPADTQHPHDRPWRGVIRHVQTSEEIHFARVVDALSFIARYVDIEEGDGGYHATEGDDVDTAERGSAAPLTATGSTGDIAQAPSPKHPGR